MPSLKRSETFTVGCELTPPACAVILMAPESRARCAKSRSASVKFSVRPSMSSCQRGPKRPATRKAASPWSSTSSSICKRGSPPWSESRAIPELNDSPQRIRSSSSSEAVPDGAATGPFTSITPSTCPSTRSGSSTVESSGTSPTARSTRSLTYASESSTCASTGIAELLKSTAMRPRYELRSLCAWTSVKASFIEAVSKATFVVRSPSERSMKRAPCAAVLPSMASALYGPLTVAASLRTPPAGSGPKCPRRSSSERSSECAASCIPLRRSVKKVLSTCTWEPAPTSMATPWATIFSGSASTVPMSLPRANSSIFRACGRFSYVRSSTAKSASSRLVSPARRNGDNVPFACTRPVVRSRIQACCKPSLRSNSGSSMSRS